MKKVMLAVMVLSAVVNGAYANDLVVGPTEPNTTQPTVTGYNSVALGVNTTVSGTSTIVLGRNNNVVGDNNVIIGANNGTINAGQSTFIGYNNTSEDNSQEQTVIGANSTVGGQGAMALGTHAVVTSIDAVGIGNNIVADKPNSVALGTNSVTELPNPRRQIVINNTTHVFAGDSPDSVVSVGTRGRAGYGGVKYYTRQITNVAAGQVEADSLDAINGSQLYAVADEVNINGNNIATNTKAIENNSKTIANNTKAINDLSKIAGNHENRIQTLESTDKSLKTDVANTQNQVNINTKDIADLKGKVGASATAVKNELNNRINQTEQRINKMGASSAALAGLHPMGFNKDDKFSASVAYGHYKNANAVALGAYYRPNEKVLLGIAGTFGSENMYNVSASFKFGKHSEYEPQAKRDGEIEAMKAQIAELTARLDAVSK